MVGKNLTLASDENNLTITAVETYDRPTFDGQFTNKQYKFIIAETLPAGTSRLFDALSNNFRAINVTTPLSITATSDSYLTIACDSYTKKGVTDQINDLVNAAPLLLNTLGQIASYLGNPTDTSTSLISTIANKANISDTFKNSDQ